MWGPTFIPNRARSGLNPVLALCTTNRRETTASVVWAKRRRTELYELSSEAQTLQRWIDTASAAAHSSVDAERPKTTLDFFDPFLSSI